MLPLQRGRQNRVREEGKYLVVRYLILKRENVEVGEEKITEEL